MQRAGPALAHDRRVSRRDVADMGGEAERRVESIEASHRPVTNDLRHDRRGCDSGALLVAVDDGAVHTAPPGRAGSRRRAARPPRPTAWRAAARALRLQRCSPKRSISPGETTSTATFAAVRRTATKRDSRSSGSSCFESFSRASGEEPAAAQILVVEQDGRRDERPGEAATPCLVRPRDEAGVETPVERDEPAAAAARRRQSRPRPRLRAHRARITSSAAVSRGRAPSYPLSRASSTAWRGSRRRSPARRSSRSSASGAGRCARRRCRTTACGQ